MSKDMAVSDKRDAGRRGANEYGAPRDLLNDFESRLSKQVKLFPKPGNTNKSDIL